MNITNRGLADRDPKRSRLAARTAAAGAGVLIAGVAGFQLALALGLPLGAATLGGRAPTTNGVLAPNFRALAGASAVVLVAMAWLVLARGGLLGAGPLSDTFVSRATWAIFGFLALNTVANFAAPHPIERWVMGTLTLVVLALLCVVAVVPHRSPATIGAGASRQGKA